MKSLFTTRVIAASLAIALPVVAQASALTERAFNDLHQSLNTVATDAVAAPSHSLGIGEGFSTALESAYGRLQESTSVATRFESQKSSLERVGRPLSW